jgi:ketosteroid isomerase-like protein
MNQDVEAITRATQDWVAAFEAGDLSGSTKPLTDDAVLVPPHEPEVAGRNAYEVWARGMLAAVEIDEATATVDDVRVAGDWAVSRGTWSMKGKAGGAPMVDTTRYVLLWERRGGSWKITYDIWNSELPAGGG